MRTLLIALLSLVPTVAWACECIPPVRLFAPGGDIVDHKPVFFVDTGEHETVDLRVQRADGRDLPFVTEPYGAHVLRVRVKRRLPLGAELVVTASAPPGSMTDASDEERFVVGRALAPPVGQFKPHVWRDRNTSFCGTTEYVGLQWAEPTPGAYALWLSDDGSPAPDAPPLMVSKVYVQEGESVINAELESCWGDGPTVQPPPWREGASKLILRRIQIDGSLDAPVVLPLPEPPVETWSGLN